VVEVVRLERATQRIAIKRKIKLEGKGKPNAGSISQVEARKERTRDYRSTASKNLASNTGYSVSYVSSSCPCPNCRFVSPNYILYDQHFSHILSVGSEISCTEDPVPSVDEYEEIRECTLEKREPELYITPLGWKLAEGGWGVWGEDDS